MERLAQLDVADVDVHVLGDVPRVALQVQLMHDLVEDAALEAHALGGAEVDDGDLDRDLLPGDELLEVQVQDVALEGVALGAMRWSRRSVSRALVTSDCGSRPWP